MDVFEISQEENERIRSENLVWYRTALGREAGQESIEERNGTWVSENKDIPEMSCACVHIAYDDKGRIRGMGNFGVGQPLPENTVEGDLFILVMPLSANVENLKKAYRISGQIAQIRFADRRTASEESLTPQELNLVLPAKQYNNKKVATKGGDLIINPGKTGVYK